MIIALMKSMFCLLLLATAALAQAPKTVPPPGIEVPPADRAELEAGLASLRAATEARSARRSLRRAARRGPRPPGWWCAATYRRSIGACSRTGWWCRRHTRPTRRTAGASTSGFTAARKPSAR
ncbi:exported hypothetical protein [Candidatus Sulfopaludibacter sp. SbA4]|nr:exported hypothetical protein [Candidatus Sulfopaludibacter sp. SbA4]